MGSLFLGLFFTTDNTYSIQAIVKGILVAFLSTCGTICLCQALQSGKGGPILAIDSLKSLPPLILNVIYVGLVPTVSQRNGVAIGIIGAIIVGLS